MTNEQLPIARGPRHIAAFERAGWTCVRIRGSHHILTKAGHAATLSVPCHKGKDVKRGLLRALIRDAGMSVEEYLGHFYA